MRGVSPVSPSVRLSRRPRAFLHDGWMNFLHIGYQKGLDSYKIEFGSEPNLSNYDYFFINFECLLCYLWEDCEDFVHIWYCYQVQCVAHACKIAIGSVPNLSNYGHFFIFFCVFVVISQGKNGLILFIFCIYSNQVPCIADTWKI